MLNHSLILSMRILASFLWLLSDEHGRYNMGAETPSPDTHPYKPHNHTNPPLSVLHCHTNPLLPQLGLPTNPLLQSISSQKMGILILPQKGLHNGYS